MISGKQTIQAKKKTSTLRLVRGWKKRSSQKGLMQKQGGEDVGEAIGLFAHLPWQCSQHGHLAGGQIIVGGDNDHFAFIHQIGDNGF